MRLEALREFCLSFPHADEKEAWEVHILFRVATKMFCISTFEPTNHSKIVFKCSPEDFAELVEREGIIPAPHMARSQWVALLDWDTLPASELREYITRSYQIIYDKLPKKTKAELEGGAASPAAAKKPSKTRVVKKAVKKRSTAKT